MRKQGFTLTELIVVIGIVSLVMGAMLTFLITSRSAADFSEARLRATEYAQRAMAQIVKELRLSNPSKVRITHNMGWIPEARPGEVINFQIPVGIYGTLDLDYGNWLKWGTEDTEGHFIAYSVNGNSQLLRSTYGATDASDAVSRVITPHISSMTFNRTDSNSDLIHIVITAQMQSPRPISYTLESDVKLRN